MNKVIFILFFVFSAAAIAQNQFQFEADAFRLKLNTDNRVINQALFNMYQTRIILDLKTQENTFDEMPNTQKLFSALENYSFVTDNSNTFNPGRVDINLDYLGKRFFDNYYDGYQNDLSKYIPQVPDANFLCPIY